MEFVTVLFLEAAFQSLGHVSVVAWYSAQWYGTVGLFGPFGLFLMTLTAPIAYLFSVGVATLWAVVVRGSLSSQ